MKTFTFIKTFCTFLFVLLSVSSLKAQVDKDPFLGNYILGNSAEMYLMYQTDNTEAWLYDFQSASNIITGNKLQEFQLNNSSYADVCMGDFDGDGKDDAIQATVGAEGSSFPNQLLLQVSGSWEPMAIGPISTNIDPNIRLIEGDFDGDAQKEFVLAYINSDNTIHIELYETDSLKSMMSITENPINFSAGLNLGSEALFDIAAGDFDGDGLDEIVFVQNRNKILTDPSKEYIAEVQLKVRIYDYDYLTKKFNQDVFEISKNIDLRKHERTNGGNSVHKYRRLLRLSVASGNITNSTSEEFIIGYSFNRDHYLRSAFWNPWYLTRHLEFYLLSFQVEGPGTYRIFDILEQQDPNFKGAFWQTYSDQIRDPGGTKWDSLEYSLIAPLNIVCADLDGNGFDEVITSGAGDISVWPDDYALNFNIPPIPIGGQNSFQFYKFNAQQRRNFTVIDLDADTSQVTAGNDTTITNWHPEIVILDCSVPFKSQTLQSNPALRISVWNVDMEHYTANLKARQTIENVDFTGNHTMSVGDFDGDALRMGRPKIFTTPPILQPIVILNTPPIHFDIFDTIYDINQAFIDVNPTKEEVRFYSDYLYILQRTDVIEAEFHRDWGVSSSLTLKAIAAGNGVKATLSGHYGEKFDKITTEGTSVTVTENVPAIRQDWIYALNTEYKVREYPVYYKGDSLGTVLVVDPIPGEGKWISNYDWKHWSHWPNHEVGNILSYRHYDQNQDISPSGQSFFRRASEFTVNKNSAGQSWIIDFDKFTTNSTSTERSFGFGADVLVKAGYEAEIEGHGLDFGVEFNVGGYYDQNEITTLTSSFQRDIQFETHLSYLNSDPSDETTYLITPYVYWSHNGAIVVDYYAEPKEAPSGETPTWWDKQYGTKPDLAFILPWRYHSEKGIGNESDRYKTTEILFSPTSPVPGDTVTILTRVHNFSLTELNQDTVDFQFYLGDPDDGGIPLPGVFYQRQAIGDFDITQPRGQRYIHTKWVVPADILSHPRIYAVLDPGNKINEIHEDNNKGWVVVPIDGVTDVEDDGRLTIPKNHALYQNYPNPFNPSTQISFSISNPERVRIDIFNVLGQKVHTLVNMKYQAGQHIVKFDASRFASGLYFYKLEAGNYSNVRKMLLMK